MTAITVHVQPAGDEPISDAIRRAEQQALDQGASNLRLELPPGEWPWVQLVTALDHKADLPVSFHGRTAVRNGQVWFHSNGRST